METNYFKHHGIKGMKWGIRRTEAQLNGGKKSYRKSESDDAHEDYNKAHSKTSVKSMSDKELRERINRLQMEKQYVSLTKKEKSAGSKFVADVLRESGKNLASKYVSNILGGAIDKGLGSVASNSPKARVTMEALNLIKKKD